MNRGLLVAVLLAILGTASMEAQVLGTPVYKSPNRSFKRSELAGIPV